MEKVVEKVVKKFVKKVGKKVVKKVVKKNLGQKIFRLVLQWVISSGTHFWGQIPLWGQLTEIRENKCWASTRVGDPF